MGTQEAAPANAVRIERDPLGVVLEAGKLAKSDGGTHTPI